MREEGGSQVLTPQAPSRSAAPGQRAGLLPGPSLHDSLPSGSTNISLPSPLQVLGNINFAFPDSRMLQGPVWFPFIPPPPQFYA